MDSVIIKGDFVYDAFWQYDVFYVQLVRRGSKPYHNASGEKKRVIFTYRSK